MRSELRLNGARLNYWTIKRLPGDYSKADMGFSDTETLIGSLSLSLSLSLSFCRPPSTLYVCVCVCVRACVFACARACVRVYVGGVYVSVLACVRAYVCVCM